MDIDAEAPDTPKRTPTAPLRDPLIRYSVFAALACAGVCMLFTIIYVFSYSLDSTLSFERHFDSYISPANAANLPTVLGLHNAQNRMFLQSCGMVAGIFFAFLGLALFLVGIQGTVDANGEVRDYSTNVKRLAPGGVIMLASMIFVGVSAMHPHRLRPRPLSLRRHRRAHRRNRSSNGRARHHDARPATSCHRARHPIPGPARALHPASSQGHSTIRAGRFHPAPGHPPRATHLSARHNHRADHPNRSARKAPRPPPRRSQPEDPDPRTPHRTPLPALSLPPL